MQPGQIKNANLFAGAPENWDPERDGDCEVLPVLTRIVNKHMLMTSEWIPSPEEIKAIIMGAPVRLHVYGMNQHPVVLLDVGEEPENV